MLFRTKRENNSKSESLCFISGDRSVGMSVGGTKYDSDSKEYNRKWCVYAYVETLVALVTVV